MADSIPDVVIAGLTPDVVIAGLTPDVVIAGLTPDVVIAGLTRNPGTASNAATGLRVKPAMTK